MKKTLNVDGKLFQGAEVACGATTDTETVRLGLEALARHAAYERLRALLQKCRGLVATENERLLHAVDAALADRALVD